MTEIFLFNLTQATKEMKAYQKGYKNIRIFFY